MNDGFIEIQERNPRDLSRVRGYSRAVTGQKYLVINVAVGMTNIRSHLTTVAHYLGFGDDTERRRSGFERPVLVDGAHGVESGITRLDIFYPVHDRSRRRENAAVFEPLVPDGPRISNDRISFDPIAGTGGSAGRLQCNVGLCNHEQGQRIDKIAAFPLLVRAQPSSEI